jgi:hypothetical protein
MSDIVYVSKSHIKRKEGPLRIAHFWRICAPTTNLLMQLALFLHSISTP